MYLPLIRRVDVFGRANPYKGIRMNTLNHLNLSTSDIAGLADFFIQIFDFRVVDAGGAGNFVVMTSKGGFVLTLMKDKNLREKPYPAGFHVGFLQPNRGAVQHLHARIQAINLPVASPGLMRGSTFGFYVQAPGGVLVEISCRARC